MLAVLVPVAVPRSGPDAVVAAAPATPACPDRLPTAPDDGSGPGDLLPATVTGAVLCFFGDGSRSTDPLTGVARLTAAEASSLAARLAAAPAVSPAGVPCTDELSATFAIRFAGRTGAATLRVETYGCAARTARPRRPPDRT